MTTALIFLPVAGALLVMVLPLRPFAVGSTALLVALAEIALWIDTVARFDFDKPGLQLAQQQTWFSDLNVSYHVGFYGFSVWLVGLTAVVLAAAVGYAFWAGRERAPEPDPGARVALDQDFHCAVGKLQKLQHGRKGADLVNRIGCRIIVASVLLRSEQDLFIGTHNLFERRD